MTQYYKFDIIHIMKISGFQKLSLVDFDGHMSATIFVSGCNFLCPFCHNSGLVKSTETELDKNEIFEYLKKRFGLLDSVCISGGEPTLYPDIPEFISQIKQMGYLVKLDTNGTNPKMIKNLVENKLIDYIAMDIKNDLDGYTMTIGKNFDLSAVEQSIKYIMSCQIDYEFRTTLVEQFHNEKSISNISKLIKNAKKYYLQKFVDSGNCLENGLKEVSKEQAKKFQDILMKNIPNTKLRGY